MKRRNDDLIGTSKGLFYFLSFTVGFPMTLLGAFVAIIMLIKGRKPKMFFHCICFPLHKGGSFSLGCFIYVGNNCKESVYIHELGHSVQNCLYGLLMPFIVSIPSFIRYHYRNFCEYKLHKRLTSGYESVWFEFEATQFGKKYVKRLNQVPEN